jgi:cytochrome P450
MSVTQSTTESPQHHPLPPLHRVRLPEPGPPHRAALPNGTPVWLVTRYDDVRTVLSDPRMSRSLLTAADAPALSSTPNLLSRPDLVFNQDGPEHLRLRRTVQGVFTPRAVRRMRPWVAEVVEQTLDALIAPGPPADLVDGFAAPLPLAVMNRLLGLEHVPSDRRRRWAEHAFANDGRDAGDVASVMAEFSGFVADLVAERRRTPGEDLISMLVRSADEEGVPEAQVVHLIVGLMSGGHDSTMTMLGNSLLFLLGERPDTWARLGSDEESAALLTERLLHLIPLGDPGEKLGNLRRAASDIDIGGVLIRAGDVVAASQCAASRDPAAYPQDPFDDLFAPLPSPTLALGAGQHYCLGAWLARTEITLALHRLAARIPGLHLTVPPAEVDWRLGMISRSPRHLPAAW